MAQNFTIEELEKRFHAPVARKFDWSPHYNLPPKTDTLIPIVIVENGKRKIQPAVWGLLPSSSPDEELRLKYETFNAKIETMGASRVFGASLRHNQFCLIPVSGYYEWYKKLKPSQPVFIHTKDGKIDALAGLWAKWESKDKSKTVYSFTVITRDALGAISQIHTRMPITLVPQNEEHLIDPRITVEEKLKKWLKEIPDSKIEIFPVERALVSFAKEEPQCMKPTEMNLDEMLAQGKKKAGHEETGQQGSLF